MVNSCTTYEQGQLGAAKGLFATLGTVAYQALLSMDFSRQEYWSGLQFHSPGDLPNPGIEPTSPMSLALAGEFFTTESLGKPQVLYRSYI